MYYSTWYQVSLLMLVIDGVMIETGDRQQFLFLVLYSSFFVFCEREEEEEE